MRVRILFQAKKLPILYRHRFMSLIKEALKISDPGYKESLYPDKQSEHSKVVKPFCFSVSLPYNRTAKKEKITIDEEVEIEDIVFYFPKNSYISLYISSYDPQFIMYLYNGILEMKSFPFGNEIELRFDRAFLLREKNITISEALFKVNSPILIEDKNGKPIFPSDHSFNEHFNAIHDRILKDIRNGQGLYKKMDFIPVEINKQVVKHTLKGFREKTGKPYMFLTCFEGCFKIRGDPKDLQMLYQIGIGLRTGQGFGMVEMV